MKALRKLKGRSSHKVVGGGNPSLDDLKEAVSGTNKAAQPVAAVTTGPDLTFAVREKIGPNLQEVLLKYSGVASDEIEDHVCRVREKALNTIGPQPSILDFSFLNMDLPDHPVYDQVLSRLLSSFSSTPSTPSRLLELGTGMGANLRTLALDGAPSHLLHGTDIQAEYEALGHALFVDSTRFADRFLAADLFSKKPTALTPTEGSWDILLSFRFLARESYKDQLLACRRMLRLLNCSRPGSWIVGAEVGAPVAGDVEFDGGLVAFRHSVESFGRMWDAVADSEGVELEMQIENDARVLERYEDEDPVVGVEVRFFYLITLR